MKPQLLASIAILAALVSTGCDKNNDEASARQIAELQRKTEETLERNRQLELENQEQKLAAERDAIERERMLIEEDRLRIEQQTSEDAALAEERLRQREQELAKREGQVDQLQSTLEEQENDIDRREVQLSERDRDLAGTQAISLVDSGGPAAPVGDYGMFYDSLSSYGSWFESPDYGYVWQPIVVRDTTWRPYTRGRWACSDHGWVWRSDEPFGWATYHYGRWCLLRGRGWVWVPGSEWAPAWVTWRSGGNHVGWAPLPPETLAYRGHRWGSTVEASFGIGSLWFNFVETRNFGRPIHGHCLPYRQNHNYINQTANITNIYIQNNRVICGGPKYRDFKNHGVPYYRLDLDRHGRPGRDAISMASRVHGDRLRIAAPDMNVAWNEGLKPKHIKGRLDKAIVERPTALRPEITDHFREERKKKRHEAEQSITRFGGRDNFNKVRTEQFEKNRRDLEQRDKREAATRDALAKADKKNGKKDPKPDGPKFDDRNLRDRQLREEAQRRKEQEKNATNQRDKEARRTKAESENQRAEEARREQAEKASRKPIERAQQQQEAARREQAEKASRKQIERAQQQQEAARREQAEKASRKQMERAQQQQEAARREQAEKASRKQMDRAQQQQEATRREQVEKASRKQMERAQQQQEAAHREQQQRQQLESSRRGQQREQMERAKQQESNRREQQQQRDQLEQRTKEEERSRKKSR